MEGVVITTDDVSRVAPASPTATEPTPAAATPLWARLVLLPLIPVLPVLAVVAIIMRVALRNEAPRVRHKERSSSCFFVPPVLAAGMAVDPEL